VILHLLVRMVVGRSVSYRRSVERVGLVCSSGMSEEATCLGDVALTLPLEH
jgi:hypothetical protein